MFNISCKVLRRKGTHYLSFKITNAGEHTIKSVPGHGVYLRPQKWITEDGVVSDPDFGRSSEITSLPAGGFVVVKVQIPEKELAPGSNTFRYGVVKEFIQWFQPLKDVVIEIKKEKDSE
jgi:hypothetical protein